MRIFLKALAWVSLAVIALMAIAYCKNIKSGNKDQDEQPATVPPE